MLIYRFHHPLLHNTTRMRFMNINILSRLFIERIYNRLLLNIL